jgi:hypothetical protein
MELYVCGSLDESGSNFTHSCSLYLRSLRLGKPRRLPGAEFSNRQVAKTFTWPRRQPVIHYNSVDSSVVWNDWLKASSLHWPASAPLQRVHNVFQTVIDVVHREARTLNVQANFNFQFVLFCITNK